MKEITTHPTAFRSEVRTFLQIQCRRSGGSSTPCTQARRLIDTVSQSWNPGLLPTGRTGSTLRSRGHAQRKSTRRGERQPAFPTSQRRQLSRDVLAQRLAKHAAAAAERCPSIKANRWYPRCRAHRGHAAPAARSRYDPDRAVVGAYGDRNDQIYQDADPRDQEASARENDPTQRETRTPQAAEPRSWHSRKEAGDPAVRVPGAYLDVLAFRWPARSRARGLDFVALRRYRSRGRRDSKRGGCLCGERLLPPSEGRLSAE